MKKNTSRNLNGRPPKKLADGTLKYDIENMCIKIDEYIDSKKEDIPILKECCLLNDWDYDYFMELKRNNHTLSQSSKKLLGWKEVNLERFGLTGCIEKTMAIFSLKQLGWSDKQDIQITKSKDDAAEELDKIISDVRKK